MWNYISKIARALWVPEYRRAVLHERVFASTEHDDIISGLDLATIVDIGANRGQFALCARRHYPAAKIYSFEPLAKPAGVYRRLFRNDANARLVNKAISARPGPASMHVSRWDVSSSLLPFAQAQHDNFPFTEESCRESILAATLSECLDATAILAPALLKLDVQGYELVALQGCEDLLPLFRFVYVEASFIELYEGQALASEVMAYLLGKEFKLLCVANLSRGKGKRPIQADFLFTRG
jgi:FkbM family methyltransferase